MTVAAMASAAGATARRTPAQQILKKIGEGQVIVVVQTVPKSEIRGAGLQGFKTCDHIRRQLVKEVRAVGLVLADAASGRVEESGADVGVAVVMLPGQEMEAETLGRDQFELGPTAATVNGQNVAGVDNPESLPDAAGSKESQVFSFEESSGQLKMRDRVDEPIEKNTWDGAEPAATWVVLVWKPEATSIRRSAANFRKNSKRPSRAGRYRSRVEANAAGTLAAFSAVCMRATWALSPLCSPKESLCSKRACGAHTQRFPAPVRGETPTCDNESGSRNEMRGLSCATVRLRVFQSIPKVAVRIRSRLFKG